MEDETPWTSITVSWQEDNALCLQSRCCRSIRHPSIFLNLVSNFLCSAFLLCVTVSKVRLLLLIVFEYGMITVNLKCLIKCPQEGPYVILCLTCVLHDVLMRKRTAALHRIAPIVFVKVTVFTQQKFRQRQLLAHTHRTVCTCSRGLLLKVGDTRGQLRALLLSCLHSCLSLGLHPREELGAGENQWSCRHSGLCLHVQGCHLYAEKMLQSNKLVRCINSWQGFWAHREDWIHRLHVILCSMAWLRNTEPMRTGGIIENFLMTTFFLRLDWVDLIFLHLAHIG